MKPEVKPEVPARRRQDLLQEVKQDQEARVQRCRVKIEAALKEENCVLTAHAGLEEVQPGKFLTVTSTGIRAL